MKVSATKAAKAKRGPALKKNRAAKILKRNVRPAAKAAGHWIPDGELARLRDNLREAQETLDAIRSGEVDAVVVSGAKGSQIYSLTGAEQPYRVYVERMQEGAVTVTADGLVLYCNQRFADMLQTPLERVMGAQVFGFFDKPAWQKISTVLGAGEEVIKHESNLQPAKNGALPVLLTASRLPVEDQNVICLVVTDLTLQKKEGELRLAKEVAEKANHAKDDFLAALSHELRTPLTPVLMNTMALEQNTSLPEEVRETLTMIRRNVELEARLIDDLLDLTRIARGKMELTHGETDIHAVVQRALEICRSDISGKSQTLTLKLEAKKFLGEGDAIRLQQAMWNLIRNAAKFTPPKGSIVIRTKNIPPDRISVEVQDTGVGFEPSQADKLFQAFEQGGRHVTRQFGGLGLGLAITRSIVQAHGGTIEAHSLGLGKGATFTFTIPLRPGKGRHVKKISPSPAVNHPTTGKRILLVEDHKDTRTSLEFLLRKKRHEVNAAASAQEAIKLAEENDFDLVISDIGLPDQSGLQLMAQLRDRFGLRGIGLSGYGMEEDIAKAQAAGFFHHLTKPVRFDELNQVIANM